ncbi:MAG: biopolymer transporter ExbD [Polyangiales bacterium]
MPARLTPRQRAYVRKRTKHVDLDPSELGDELNIVPFLDIVVNLIMFLLMVTSAVAFFSQVEASLPELRSGGIGKRANDEPALNLNVTITNEGELVTAAGGKLAPGCATTAPGRVVTVPLRADGKHDWVALQQCVERIKSEYEDEERVTLSADPQVEYEHVISAMDAVRGTDDKPLFPEVLLSAGVR